jgi:hypothetical protein
VARDVHRLERLQEVQGLLRDWATSAGPAHPYQADYLRHRDELDARGRCLNVLLDAATATVLADVLSADEVHALWGPWEAFSLPADQR